MRRRSVDKLLDDILAAISVGEEIVTLARDQAAAALDLTPTGGGDLPPLQRVALQTHIADLDRVISELQLRDAPDGEEADPADA